MPAPSTCDEFLDVVRGSGVVDEKRLGAFLEPPEGTSSLPDAPQQMAETMLKAGLITPFQMDLLLQGKRRGFIIADKYILLDHLGAGGMGSVYLCEHKVMRRRVAIKVLPSAFADNPEYLDRFHREARAVAVLDHPNIVRAFDVDHDAKMHFLVMEYIEGCSLHQLVSREGPLGVRQAADYISQAASGLQSAQEAGLVHRDIKPANLLVDRKGTVKILDMGLAVFFQEKESLTQQYDASAILGTADYLAPEQIIDSHGVDIRADIYSLGLTFYFLLIGSKPFGEGTVAQKLLWHQMRGLKSVREHRPEVPEGLAAVITKMLAKDRAERYQTPAEVVEALAPWVRGEAEPGLAPLEPPALAAPAANALPPAPVEAEPTLKASAETPKTITQSNRKGAGSAARAGKGPKVSRPTSSSKQRVRGPKSGKLAASEDSSVLGQGREGRSSAKHRRKPAPVGFWTTPRVIWISSVGGLVLLLSVAGIIWAVTRHPKEGPVAVVTAPRDSVPPSGALPSTTPTPPPSPSTVKEPPKDTPPNLAVVNPKPPDVKPPQDPNKKPDPQPGTLDPKVKPPKVEPKKEPKVGPPPPPAKKKESFIDYVPKAGTTLFYDIGDYRGTNKAVVRQRWDVKDKGEIEVTNMKAGLVKDKPLLEGGTSVWAQTGQKKLGSYRYKTSGDHVEMGPYVQTTKTTVYEPILPRSGAEGDTWKWHFPNGDTKTYTIVKYDKYKNLPAVVVKDTMPGQDFQPPLPEDTRVVTIHTYVKGMGEVARSVNVEKKDAKPLLVSEWKLVED